MRIRLALFLAGISVLQQTEASEKTRSRKSSKPVVKRSAFATYINGRFGFEVSYPKGWKIKRSQNGDGMHATKGKQEFRVAASFFNALGEVSSTKTPLSNLIYKEFEDVKIDELQKITVKDTYKNREGQALIGFGTEKSTPVSVFLTLDENIAYKGWATNIPKNTARSLFETFKITKGEEKY